MKNYYSIYSRYIWLLILIQAIVSNICHDAYTVYTKQLPQGLCGTLSCPCVRERKQSEKAIAQSKDVPLTGKEL